MHLRTLSLSFVLLLLGLAACLAQQPTGPATLENLLNSNESPKTAESDASPKQPAGTVARPEDGVQHPDLDKAWADYDAAVVKVTESMKAAISKQFDAATAKGDLDAAEKWQASLEKFEKAGEVPSESETKSAVSAAVADYKNARGELTKAYEAVVKALTMEKKIVEAKAARDEARGIEGGSGSLEDGRAARGRPAEQSAKTTNTWVVLFRSRTPAHWNRQFEAKDSFAMPLTNAPKGVRYLSITRESNNSFIIVPMTSDALGSDGAISDEYGWSGRGHLQFNAHHLGVYSLRGKAEPKQVAILTGGADLRGWGFGHKTYVDQQSYSWAGVEIPPTIFEIAVKCDDLTNSEKKHLLTK